MVECFPVDPSGFSCLHHLSPNMFCAYQFRGTCRGEAVADSDDISYVEEHGSSPSGSNLALILIMV